MASKERYENKMKIFRENSYEDVSKRAADIIAAQVIISPGCVLGLATGSSPIGAYKKLIEMNKLGEIDFSHVKTANLDEYIGLKNDNVNSYHYFMNDNLFNHININKENTHVPEGYLAANDPDKACLNYDHLIKSLGQIDLQLLGIGQNGHIGFNEPSDAFSLGTHVVSLTESTINANARLFDDISEVPTKAITMGIKNIMQAKKVLLIACGKEKAEAIQKAIHGPVSPDVPASILQLHPDLTIITDHEAITQ